MYYKKKYYIILKKKLSTHIFYNKKTNIKHTKGIFIHPPVHPVIASGPLLF